MDGQSHEEVEAAFSKELKLLGSGANNNFYHGGLKRNVRVHLELFASLQDQPEQRKANYIMLGRSTYTAQWGLALDFPAVAVGIPACKNCLSLLLTNASPINVPQCSECVNWDTSAKSGLLDFDPPQDYPQDLIPLSGKLSPKRISYDMMMAAVQTAHNEIVSSRWGIATMRAFLRVQGLNEEAVSSIKECDASCEKYLKAQSDAEGDETFPALVAIEVDPLRNPKLDAMWEFPATWHRSTELRQRIDVAMRLIFLGTIKTCMQDLHDWMVKQQKGSAFLNYSNGMFEAVQKLGLSWSRCQPYKTGKLAG